MRQQLGLIVFKVVATPLNGVKPTIVLVHGAWADTSSWDGEVAALTKQGYVATGDREPTGEPHHRLRRRRELPQSISGPSCWSAIPTADR